MLNSINTILLILFLCDEIELLIGFLNLKSVNIYRRKGPNYCNKLLNQKIYMSETQIIRNTNRKYYLKLSKICDDKIKIIIQN